MEEIRWEEVEPIKMDSTWRNTRVEEDRVAKISDCFLIYDSLIQDQIMIMSWIDIRWGIEHMPVFMQFQREGFKFNPTWLEDDMGNPTE
jgi:hypothetical protein